ncbi:uncharacterized protein G2W53_001480 [Senna tora]|uniref:Uncharacterized protein n=1 Tax=Senna tora TaxID=362788 RepID=A0A835CLJ2_9FABA|nr:uncharacterized protein G2W53_001480 [Senna tora]
MSSSMYRSDRPRELGELGQLVSFISLVGARYPSDKVGRSEKPPLEVPHPLPCPIDGKRVEALSDERALVEGVAAPLQPTSTIGVISVVSRRVKGRENVLLSSTLHVFFPAVGEVRGALTVQRWSSQSRSVCRHWRRRSCLQSPWRSCWLIIEVDGAAATMVADPQFEVIVLLPQVMEIRDLQQRLWWRLKADLRSNTKRPEKF